ncbi:hypothetical protein FHQ18_03340 [Deferribacter autotrophicus]|uniref:Nucleotide-diphospho-sugar transferase domain-containing protein n=1 Tax=Deferribacter autotrophicus TaxID=500465 RepID=A0A5A8F4T9_9BACT|nr:putative nucleotide-diphospho-sugar transferase [Deferribacter autotrophicus]KAA0258997.1 hypothetical protein FHQ18_03340 [Deferribacter autotrophicus]
MKLSDYEIVTAADKNYIEFAKAFTRSVNLTLNKTPYIFDLGGISLYKDSLNAQFIDISVNSDYNKINKQNCIRTIHKPECIKYFINKFKKHFIFIDADCLFLKNSFLPSVDVDIFFTFKIYKDQTCKDFQKNGIINAGVLIFNVNEFNIERLNKFIDKWHEYCLRDSEITDQKALSLILEQYLDIRNLLTSKFETEEISFRFLSSELYNDTSCKTGVIWHFKQAAREQQKFKNFVRISKNVKLYSAIREINLILYKIKKLLNPKRYAKRYINELRLYLEKENAT